MMQATSRRRKGKAFEDKVADLIHKVLLEELTEYRKQFNSFDNKTKALMKPQRDSSSGSNKTNKSDIALNLASKYLPFVIECKKHRGLTPTVYQLLTNGKLKLLQIYNKQLLLAADVERRQYSQKLYPILVWADNYERPQFIIELSYLQDYIKNHLQIDLQVLLRKLKNAIIVRKDTETYLIGLFEEFLRATCKLLEERFKGREGIS